MKTLKASLTPLYLNNMIDIEYTSKQVDTTSFTDNPPRPVLFLGFVIKNEYDNLRIKLNEKYNPKKFIIFINDGKGTPSGMIPLYGIALTPNDNIKKLMQTLHSQEEQGVMNLEVYEKLISQFDLQCKETYGYFQQGVYPIDFTNLKSVCDDTFNSDKKIFQHLLDLDEKVFDFQRFASLKLFILTV